MGDWLTFLCLFFAYCKAESAVRTVVPSITISIIQMTILVTFEKVLVFLFSFMTFILYLVDRHSVQPNSS